MPGIRTHGRRVCRSVARSASGIALDSSGPARLSGRRARLVFATALLLAITAGAAAVYVAGPGVVTTAWLAVGPLLASLVLSPRITAVVAGWTVMLGLGLALDQPGPMRMVASHLSVLALLAAFAVTNAVLRTAAQPGPGRGPGSAERAAPRGTGRRHHGAAGLTVCVSLGRGPGGRRPARGRPRHGAPALAHWRHPRKGPPGGAPGQRRDDQLPGRLCPAGPVAARGRPGRGPVRHACRGRRGLRDRGLRRARPWRLASARDLRAPAAAAARGRRRPAAADPPYLRDAARPAPRHPAIHVLGQRRRPAAVLHRRPARGARPGGPVLQAGRLPRRAAAPGPAGSRGRAARPTPRARRTHARRRRRPAAPGGDIAARLPRSGCS